MNVAGALITVKFVVAWLLAIAALALLIFAPNYPHILLLFIGSIAFSWLPPTWR